MQRRGDLTAVINVRLPAGQRERIEKLAEREHGGNLSEAMRRLADIGLRAQQERAHDRQRA